MQRNLRKERERQLRRDIIVDAAEEAFTKGGIDVSMDDVAKLADLSKSAVYKQFPSKDDLFFAVAARFVGQLVDEFETIGRASASHAEKVQRMFLSHAKLVSSNPAFFRMAINDIATGKEVDISTEAFGAHRVQCGRVMSLVVSIIEQGIAAKEFRPDIDPEDVGPVIWGTMMGNMMLTMQAKELNRRFSESRASQKAIDPNKHHQTVADLFVASLLISGEKQ